jgi:hypothetical protein
MWKVNRKGLNVYDIPIQKPGNIQINQAKGVKPKMREHKLRSVNW